MKKTALLFVGLLLSAVPAHAQVVLHDNFDAESPGVSTLNYNAFANWDVIGQVDLVRDGDFGIACSGGCVDLDGSSGPGALRTKQSFTLAAGERWTFAILVSGNQRQSIVDSDRLSLNAFFAGGAVTGAFSGTGHFSFLNVPQFMEWGSIGASADVNAVSAFSVASMSFDVQTAGTVQFQVGTSSGDNIGPILDEVTISKVVVSTVPEPSSLALMFLGLGALVAVQRRTRRGR